MKKLSIFVAIAVLMMALAACGTRDVTPGPSPTPAPPGSPDVTPASPGPTPQGPTDQGNGPGLPPVASPIPAPSPEVTTVPGLAPDSFVAVVPRRLRTGYSEQVSVSLFNGDRPAAGKVWLSLLDAGAPVGSRLRQGGGCGQRGISGAAPGAGPVRDRNSGGGRPGTSQGLRGG